MKRKMTVGPRNPFVKLALFRKAGSHRKTHKQMRADKRNQLMDV
ncbi:hypothetical protein UFOVP273_75 [uncultured Caudovirales phage]|uniref:Uncharacterized protein n=1 Tax=uncultured Caudovirales phage TaxID=2100421 RepID=A0A6J5LNI2_9CAUD|nr:hypothetical protein UFOVP273_75 [uncultured Caudovirales phage]